MIDFIKHKYTGLNTQVLGTSKIGETCIALWRVYELKPWLPRRKFIDDINNKRISAYTSLQEVFISQTTFDELDKMYFEQKINLKRRKNVD